jgi:hypothetical protein
MEELLREGVLSWEWPVWTCTFRPGDSRMGGCSRWWGAR